MKKIWTLLLVISSLFFVLPLAGKELETEELFYYNTNTNINYFNTSEKVVIPKNYTEKSTELRGVWVATVFNLDIIKTSSPESYKKEFIKILDTMNDYNMNTLFFQLRPSNDAFYKSELNPYSEFLFGHGVDKDFDPLEFMLQETKKRGIEFHAWLNAFRISPSKILTAEYASDLPQKELIRLKDQYLNALDDKSFAKKNPDTVMLGEKDSKLILNPGDLKVQQFLLETIQELIENYDIDGFHFDDYFYLSNSGGNNQTENHSFARYPYLEDPNQDLNDLRTYDDYKSNPGKYQMVSGLTLGDFRRESINQLMKNISLLVKKHNETREEPVLFGSKPAAVWRSNSKNCSAGVQRGSPEGSNTHCYAYSSYYDIFADSKKWVEEGYVDYIAPQIYFSFQSKEVPYADIVKWWAELVEKTNQKLGGTKEIQMFVAHGIYKYVEFPEQFNDPKEMMNQLKYNQMFDVIKGSAVYDYSTLVKLNSPTQKEGMSLFRSLWSKKALPLQKTTNDKPFSEKIDHWQSFTSFENHYRLTFQSPNQNYKYALFKKNLTNNREDLIDIRGFEKKITFSFLAEDNVEFYLRILSVNNIPSENSTLIQLRDAVKNEPPKIDKTWFKNDQHIYEKNSEMTFHFSKPMDPDDELLSFKVYFILRDDSNNIKRDITRYVREEEEYFTLLWDVPLILFDRGYIVIEVSDEFRTESFSSTSFSVTNKLSPPGTTTTTENEETTSTDSKGNGCSKKEIQTTDLLYSIALLFSILGVSLFIIKRK